MGVRISVVINNFNYERFLRRAIDSALAQDHPDVEIVVVDDGSTDGSPELVGQFGDRVIAVHKVNGGQASAINAGFAASTGDAVTFLDADDVLLPTAAAEIDHGLVQHGVVKVHWPLHRIDAEGTRFGGPFPAAVLADGDLRHLLERCPDHLTPPQSGNAWSRAFLERALPVPERGFETGGADTYLSMLTIAAGAVRATPEPHGEYRMHGASHWTGQSFEQRLELGLRRYDAALDALARECRRRGLPARHDVWRANSWFHRVLSASRELARLIPRGQPFILVDDGDWGMGPQRDWRPVPLLERDGVWAGPPASDSEGIADVERLRASGAGHLVVTWQAFWWLDTYELLFAHVRARYRQVLANDRLVVFDLQQAPDP